jgi:hypothetical protein
VHEQFADRGVVFSDDDAHGGHGPASARSVRV